MPFGTSAIRRIASLEASFDIDAGLKELAELKGLQTLNLSGTKTTDAGLKELAALKGLQYLDLGHTKATAAGVAKLQKALPNCYIGF